MPQFLKGPQSFVTWIIIIAVIAVGAFFIFNNQNQGEVTDEAVQIEQIDEEIANLERQIEEASPEEKEELQKQLADKLKEKKELETEDGEDTGETGEESEFPKQYTVSKGDHLWSIATRFYNDGYKWTVLAAENNIADPDIILPGQKLTIPEPKERMYTVSKGDTLWGISERFYGTGFQWKIIRKANSGAVGTLPNGNPLIVPGQVLKIP